MGRIFTFLIALILGAVISAFVIFSQLPSMMITEVESPLAFTETVDKVKANAKELGWKAPKKWGANFQANFKKLLDKDIGPMTLIKMCEPNAAVSILKHDHNKLLSVMMPCTVAVYEKSDGKTYISIMNMKLLGQIFGGEVATAVEPLAPQMMQMITFE